jgi:hydroxyethylthiazole kinase-like uncharacterized protein yjeF
MNAPQALKATAVAVDVDTLMDWPLPMPADDGDKEERGRVLVVAGSREIPGAALLAGTAALRAGAGKLALAVPACIAPGLALAMPEARVIALPENARGEVDGQAADCEALDGLSGRIDAVLVGPGMQEPGAAAALVRRLAGLLPDAAMVLDACAMDAVCDAAQPLPVTVAITPHAGEMAHLHGNSKQAVQADACGAACGAALQWNAVVALKGATTFVASPDGRLWRHAGGNVGLAVSGSGDVLAGLIAGLAARGAALEQACIWGVALHAMAGDSLARRFGPLGYLARDLSGEIPALLQSLVPRGEAPPWARAGGQMAMGERGAAQTSLW